ncbi:Na+/H+ antiporter NhaC [Parabacteroides sp. PF5-5]|uniref:Na+/H+ antiporter NhaC family protein n=1 Tax=unclassified Parabacteroides TaxID=2649774 RepID=UPI002475F2A1|nr:MULTISPECIES: Na+/H+ antiporter NhaC family protein [unclassified Parabacteroides]MDH6306356.1 Na+/H+ antiporter NhaC [Parabacteroides sp. PH5-39]MDH6314628.1 Na+/H+ antiporter NhaC [Parabacteroides sp. PF5-13]MDH6321067.1 Na+/H+ antiporter NhaC [Parabacteroides sp. PH5-13]MDH6324799.1 Na+/H+ antiporter NhaC [Parabacteroides sp. PH5-8]MDH6325520.1 Na+/H+ antiporter NhaC [Parabacteroides sp. PH5-41]
MADRLTETNPPLNHTPNPWALIPLAVFLLTYLVVSVIAGDFYKMPITVAFVIASIVAVAISKGGKLSNRIEQFCRGAANSNIMLMILIFILAGAFAQTAKDMGAVDATVNLTMSVLPGNLLAAGIFIAACFISISVGTSVGTIVALAPVAVGIAAKSGMPDALMLGVVVSGAMFGDNLSFISDTTIVATRTQGCQMSDKFKVNIRIALPVAIITAIIYIISGLGAQNVYTPEKIEWIKVVPYLIVLITAVFGVNVMVVLFIGIILSGLTGIFTGSFDIWGWNAAMGNGILSMGELIIITLLAGGMLEMIRYNGGIDWIILKLTSHIRSSKGAEVSIAGLVSFANLCTANNTIALIMSGPIAKDIADKYKVDPRRSASILDIFSCTVQGIIPYGAQLLMAASLSAVSPLEIMGYLYYPYLLGLGTLLAIAFAYPRKYSNSYKLN